jgi:hypothetical protein
MAAITFSVAACGTNKNANSTSTDSTGAGMQGNASSGTGTTDTSSSSLDTVRSGNTMDTSHMGASDTTNSQSRDSTQR